MKTYVIKLGGAALSNSESLKQLAYSVSYLKSQGHQVVVVHGGGPMINKKLEEKNITWSFFEGQRITTSEMMSAIEEALGEVNAEICSVLSKACIQNQGIPANAHDMFVVRQMDPQLGLVGDITNVRVSIINDLLKQGITPVVAPIGVNDEGISFNINADWGASKLAAEIGATNLLFATDQRGILDVHGLPYDSLTLPQLKVLMDKGGVSGGMLAKARTIVHAIENGVTKVCVIHACELIDLMETRSGGTLCVEMGRLDHILKMKEVNYAVIS